LDRHVSEAEAGRKKSKRSGTERGEYRLNGNEDVFINVKRFVAASIAKNTARGISNKNIWKKGKRRKTEQSRDSVEEIG
jgi:dihydropteroate synthase